MKLKKYEWRIISRIILLCLSLALASWLLYESQVLFLIILVPIFIFQVIDMFRFQRKAYEELQEFVESVHYRDFSRYFNVESAPTELQPLRRGFNEINTTFKVISKERETQYQYLQKILELVDTGILSYESLTGEIVWMNESLKRMLQLPYLKTIHSLEKRDEALYREILAVNSGESRVATAHVDHNSFKVLISATIFQTEGKSFKLVAFQNINNALDETEAKAWQKLLQVMTHEIMNSVAPISSLADTLKHRLKESISTIAEEPGSMDDLELGIETIKRRSEGLLKFADTYRSLNKINKLNLETIYVRDLFANILQLMQPTMEQKNIELETILREPDMQLSIDINLIEQVLINLVVNAMEAVKESQVPRITLTAYTSSNNRPVIKVSDNGYGIPPELVDQIFIPFFSTKKNGSGIGLSLCKQIISLHKGTIQVQSVEGQGSAFVLHF